MKERRMYMRPKGRGFRVLWILLAMTAMPLLAAAWVAWGPGPAGDPGNAAFIGGSRYWRLLMADPAYQRLLALSAPDAPALGAEEVVEALADCYRRTMGEPKWKQCAEFFRPDGTPKLF